MHFLSKSAHGEVDHSYQDCSRIQREAGKSSLSSSYQRIHAIVRFFIDLHQELLLRILNQSC